MKHKLLSLNIKVYNLEKGRVAKSQRLKECNIAKSQYQQFFLRGTVQSCSSFVCVPSMALILLVKVQPRVFTAKCSESQVGISNDIDGGSGVAKFLSLRTET